MADFVIVVPKPDELLSVEWAFGTRFDAPDDHTGSGVELFRRMLPFGAVTFALLDKQTNTYSSILTGDVIAHEAPRLIFMVGTAMGRTTVPIGSIVVSDGVFDISEKRYLDDGRSSYVLRSPPKSDGLTLDAKNFVARSSGVNGLMRTSGPWHARLGRW